MLGSHNSGSKPEGNERQSQFSGGRTAAQQPMGDFPPPLLGTMSDAQRTAAQGIANRGGQEQNTSSPNRGPRIEPLLPGMPGRGVTGDLRAIEPLLPPRTQVRSDFGVRIASTSDGAKEELEEGEIRPTVNIDEKPKLEEESHKLREGMDESTERQTSTLPEPNNSFEDAPHTKPSADNPASEEPSLIHAQRDRPSTTGVKVTEESGLVAAPKAVINTSGTIEIPEKAANALNMIQAGLSNSPEAAALVAIQPAPVVGIEPSAAISTMSGVVSDSHGAGTHFTDPTSSHPVKVESEEGPSTSNSSVASLAAPTKTAVGSLSPPRTSVGIPVQQTQGQNPKFAGRKAKAPRAGSGASSMSAAEVADGGLRSQASHLDLAYQQHQQQQQQQQLMQASQQYDPYTLGEEMTPEAIQQLMQYQALRQQIALQQQQQSNPISTQHSSMVGGSQSPFISQLTKTTPNGGNPGGYGIENAVSARGAPGMFEGMNASTLASMLQQQQQQQQPSRSLLESSSSAARSHAETAALLYQQQQQLLAAGLAGQPGANYPGTLLQHAYAGMLPANQQPPSTTTVQNMMQHQQSLLQQLQQQQQQQQQQHPTSSATAQSHFQQTPNTLASAQALLQQQQQPQQQQNQTAMMQQGHQIPSAQSILQQQQSPSNASMLQQHQQQQQQATMMHQQHQQQHDHPLASKVMYQQQQQHQQPRSQQSQLSLHPQRETSPPAAQFGGPSATGGPSQQQRDYQQQLVISYLAQNVSPHYASMYLQQAGYSPADVQLIITQAYAPQQPSSASTQQQQFQGKRSTSPVPLHSHTEDKRMRSEPPSSSSTAAVSGGIGGSGRNQSPDNEQKTSPSIQNYLGLVTRALPSASSHVDLTPEQQQQTLLNNAPKNPLTQAIIRGDIHALRALLVSNAYAINTLDEHGTTPLMTAAGHQDPAMSFECVKMLLSFGALARVRDRNGLTAAHWAALLDNLDSMRTILASDRQLADAPCSVKGDTPLHRAARAGKVKTSVSLVVDFNMNPLTLNGEYETVIEVAGKQIDLSGSSVILNSASRTAVRTALFEVAPYARTLVLYHSDCLRHETSDIHRENPERIKVIFRELNQAEGACGLVVSDDCPPAPVEAITRAHDPDYVSFLVDLDGQLRRDKVAQPVPFTPRVQQAMFGENTAKVKPEAQSESLFSTETLSASLRAAGSVIRGIDVVMNNVTRNAFCAVRPPGHHVGWRGLMDESGGLGYCVLNSVMIGAMHALSTYSNDIKRVAIIDFDAHHGNGTQDIIKQRVAPFSKDAVMMFGIHLFDKDEGSFAGTSASSKANKYEFFPGSGETDVWDKNIFNVPVIPLWRDGPPPHRQSEFVVRGRLGYRRAILERMVPLLRAYRPDLILVSAGFDAALDDVGCSRVGGDGQPKSGLDLTPEDYDYITKQIVRVANVCCKGRVVSVLEGGYGTLKGKNQNGRVEFEREGFAKCVTSHVMGLSGLSSLT